MWNRKQQSHMGSTAVLPVELISELVPVARKVFWYGTPEEALQDIGRFVAQVMTYGDWQDVRTTMRLLGSEQFEAVLDNPPPGVFDRKSWSYWHAHFGRSPAPDLPERRL